MPAHRVGTLHAAVSAAPRGAARKTALYDGIEDMVAEGISVGMTEATAKAVSLGVDPARAHEIAAAALADFVETRTEFLKPSTKAGFVGLDLGH